MAEVTAVAMKLFRQCRASFDMPDHAIDNAFFSFQHVAVNIVTGASLITF